MNIGVQFNEQVKKHSDELAMPLASIANQIDGLIEYQEMLDHREALLHKLVDTEIDLLKKAYDSLLLAKCTADERGLLSIKN